MKIKSHLVKKLISIPYYTIQTIIIWRLIHSLRFYLITTLIPIVVHNFRKIKCNMLSESNVGLNSGSNRTEQRPKLKQTENWFCERHEPRTKLKWLGLVRLSVNHFGSVGFLWFRYVFLGFGSNWTDSNRNRK